VKRSQVTVDVVVVRGESPNSTEYRIQAKSRRDPITCWEIVLTPEQFAAALTARVVPGVTMYVMEREAALAAKGKK
jgi:hypothetical protein